MSLLFDTPSNRPRFVLCVAAVSLFAASVFSPTAAHAERNDTPPHEESHRDDYPGFSGAFTGVTLRGGVPWQRLSGHGSGWSIDAGLRHAFPMYVGDIRAAYHLERVDSGTDQQLMRHGISTHLAFHPGFHFMAGSDWLPYVIASIYADVGVEAALYTGDLRGLGVVPSLSVGVDFPLGDPDTSPIPWLHVSWRRYLGTTLADSRAPAPYSSIQLGLAWRINRTLF